MEVEISRRADYTFKYNSNLGRHGWLRLTPAYGVKLVQEIAFKKANKGSLILDPFSGTATTGLVVAEMGFDAILFDINPFLIWLGNTKCSHFKKGEVEDLEGYLLSLLLTFKVSDDNWLPPIFNIERWWSSKTLNFLSSLRKLIVEHFGEPSDDPLKNLVWIAFCRLTIETSSAAFNHVSMSFKEGHSLFENRELVEFFTQIFKHVKGGALKPILGNGKILKGDSRDLSNFDQYKFDLVITSPPYPNRMSYIRELRPYMYWTKFLNQSSEAGELDWEAIGGTWGIATSRLKDWKPIHPNFSQKLLTTCETIENSGDKNSHLMSWYVHKYFDDLHEHVNNIRPLLNSGASVNYIVGNSSFYKIFVDTEKILAESFRILGFSDILIQPIRRRNSNKGLVEYNVSAVWN